MKRPCSFPGGCRRLVSDGDRCAQHPPTAIEARRKVQRPAGQLLYGSAEWKRASKAYLAAHPYCVCPKHQGKPLGKKGARATVVDHIRPHRGDLTLFWAETNWQALSKPCHDSWKRQLENEARAGQSGVYTAPRGRQSGLAQESFKGGVSRGLAADQQNPVRVSGGRFDTPGDFSSGSESDRAPGSESGADIGGFVLA